ncbi:YegP family protein [Bordetella petrii]|uniref:YegP family protein n=1 Tax=Bordetella petrii TaxID=94624 RepID=UPI001E3C66DD|nr:YegP family protein [Bordetella petrii]MCD0503434.1 YegP family protein [Bordetella petrii]
MAGWFELKKATNGQFHFSLKAGNGETILTSEMYAAKASAENGIASVQKNSVDTARYNPATSSNGKFYFTLRAANNQIIGNSQMYGTEAARDNGIASVKQNGSTQDIRDNS